MKSSRIAVLFATVMVDMIGFGIVLPLLPFYAESMGATPFEVTAIIASFSAMQLAAAPVWGRVSDSRGRRPLIIAGLFASAASYLIFGLADSLALLLVSRMTAGAAGGTISVAQAYVADSTEAEERAHGLGLIGAAAGLGVMLGPAIGGYFSQWGLGMPGYVAAGLSALNGIAAVFLLPESRRQPTRDRQPEGEAATLRGWLRALTRYPLSLLLAVYFLCISSFTAMTSVLALYLERVFAMDAADMGLVFTIAGATTVVIRGGVVGRLVKRFGEPRVAQAGVVILSVSLLTIPLIPTQTLIWVTVPVWSAATGTVFPSLASLVSRATDEHSQGSILGGSQVVGGLGRVLGPVWAGLLFQHIGIRSPFTTGAVLVAVALLLALRIPVPRRAREGEDAATAAQSAEDMAV